MGSVCLRNGELCSLIVNGCNTEVFQAFFNEMAKTVIRKEGEKHYIMLDNASWHHAKKLKWHDFIAVFLPPYSPDFNPVERLWLRMKADFFYDFISKKAEQLEECLCQAICSFMKDKQKLASICAYPRFN